MLAEAIKDRFEGPGLVITITGESYRLKDKRKARYQPDSAEVRNFYRVNSYPVR